MKEGVNVPTSKRDVFLCHASADKEEYVRPFVRELEAQGVSYWLDRAEIRWGDDIVKKINDGLVVSRYVVVFISENFIGRGWPEAELASALSKENASGEVVVLPILMDTGAAVFARYPLLRSKKHVTWSEGVQSIVSQLESRIARTSPDSRMVRNPDPVPSSGQRLHEAGKAVPDTDRPPTCYSRPSPLLEELVSHGAMIGAITNAKNQRDLVLYLLDSFCGVMMSKYGMSAREGMRQHEMCMALLSGGPPVRGSDEK